MSGAVQVTDSAYVDAAVPEFVTVKLDCCAELAGLVTLDGLIATLPPGATTFAFTVAESAAPLVEATTLIVPVLGGGPCV